MPRLRILLPLALLLAATACERVGLARDTAKTEFDGRAALGYVETQLAFGPRVPGTEGHRRAGDWIIAQMRERADTVIVQEWIHVTKQGDSLPMRNILARFRPELQQRVLYLTHWDTRPVADSDPVLGNRAKPIPGANDGGSGVGLFVALGDFFRKTPPAVGVDLLFVDGEDYGQFGQPLADYPDVLIGSRYFAANLPDPEYRPIFGVLWDMIGDKDLTIYQEQNSIAAAPEVVQRVWTTAAELGYSNYFVPQAKHAVDDDHIPLIQKGLRVIDVIDIDYGPPDRYGNASPSYHHTHGDTIDKISARSLQVVGDVAVTLVTRF